MAARASGTLQFQSPQPSRAVTELADGGVQLQHISIPTALAGCDRRHPRRRVGAGRFQSPQPSRAVTLEERPLPVLRRGFQSPQPSRAVTQPQRADRRPDGISIPTALAGCDSRSCCSRRPRSISIPTALAGCDVAYLSRIVGTTISIPTALAGCDVWLPVESFQHPQFQSPQPSRAVTLGVVGRRGGAVISIPTALAGCDWRPSWPRRAPPHFNPHSPRGL